MFAHSAHEHHLLEMWNVDHFHVGAARTRAARAASRECVDLIFHNVFVDVINHGAVGHAWVHLVGVVFWTNLRRRRLRSRHVSQPQRGVLIWTSGVLVSEVFGSRVMHRGLDGRVARRVVNGDLEGGTFAPCHLFERLYNALELFVDLRHDNLPLVLLLLQVLRHHGQNAFDICKLSPTSWYFQVDILDEQHGRIALDNLAVQVFGCIDPQSNLDSALLDFAGRLHLGVLPAAVGALRGHDDNLAEERYLRQKKACGCLNCQPWLDFPKSQRESYIFRVAVHAQCLFDFFDNLGAVRISFLRACLGHLAPHILEEFLGDARLCHDGLE